MATHNSAIKRHRQSLKREARNIAIASGVKSAIKKIREAIKAGKAESARELLKSAVKVIDKAVTKGVLHRNNASRRISRLTKAVNSMEKGAHAVS